MTNIIINYKWNEIIFTESKIVNFKREGYNDKISFVIRITKNENKYEYVGLTGLPRNVKMEFTYQEDSVRLYFETNVYIQDFVKENKYFLNEFDVKEVMTEPLFNKEVE